MAVTSESFLADVARHEMSILVDDGLRRHLRFGVPGTFCQRFDLITWPGHLCYTGDMGTYVFQRIDDMFEFFRGPVGRPNLDYWAEKVLAEDRDGVRQFSEERFKAVVTEQFNEFAGGLEPEERESLWESIENDVLCFDNPTECIGAANDFQWCGGHVFSDIWDHELRTFTGRYQWCCYALRWAVAQYDARNGDTAKVDGSEGRGASS